jgi:ribonuclease HI
VKDWKACERRIAEKLGGMRVPVSGRGRGDTPDVEHSTLSVEVKSRKKLPSWIHNAMRQAEASSKGDNRLPVVVLHEDRARYSEALVVLRLKDFVAAPDEEPEERAEKPTIDVYTDGGCRVDSGCGAWAAVIYDGPRPAEISGFEPHTTNNKMELRAAVEGLKQLETPSTVRLFSDSAYLVNCMNEGWYLKWERNGWKNSKKKPVENADLWRELLELARCHDVKWVKIPSHAGVAANERCHALVQLAIQQRGSCYQHGGEDRRTG